jgi:hypothetical protein
MQVHFRIGRLIVQIQATITFTISPAPPPPLQVNNTNPTGQVGVAMTGNLEITGGTPPYSVAVTDPTQLPPGVMIDTGGNFGGVPTAAGSFPVGVSVSDSGV